MLTRAFRMAFWIVHDHLGALVLCNAAWAAAAILPLGAGLALVAGGHPLLGAGLAILAVGVAGPVLGGGAAHFAMTAIAEGEASVAAFLEGVRLHARGAAALGMAALFLAAGLGAGALYYPVILADHAPLLGAALSAVNLAGLAGLALVLPWLPPALAHRRRGAIDAARTAALAAAARPVLSAGLTVHALAATALAIAFPPFLCFLALVWIATVSMAAYELLIRECAAREGGDPATSISGAGDDYLNRGLRDFFFPWRM